MIGNESPPVFWPAGSFCSLDKEMSSLTQGLFKDVSGASAAEYALILSVIGLVIVTAAFGLGDAIGNGMKIAADCIDTGSAFCR